MSDTPRTDEVFRDCPVGGDVVVYLLDHARRLERELAAAQEEIKQQALEYLTLSGQYDEAQEARQAAEADAAAVRELMNVCNLGGWLKGDE